LPAVTTVPADAAALNASMVELVRTLTAELEAQRKAAEESRRENARLLKMVEGLTGQLDVLLRDRDEERRAELAKLRQEAKAALAAKAPPAEPSEPTAPRKKSGRGRDKHGRKPIPPSVPRETTRQTPERCSACGGSRLNKKKVLVSEEWDYVRAHLRARRTERDLCECQDCFEAVVPEQPPMPFERAACTFQMMAWLCFAKVGLFLPLDRVQRDFEDQGARIPSSTLTRWWQAGADLLEPVAKAVRLSLLAGAYIRTDGTGLSVVFPRKKGTPVKGPARDGPTAADGYLITPSPYNGQVLIFGNDEHAVFHFTSSRHGYHAIDFLTLGQDEEGEAILWKGTITADAVSSQDCLFTDGERVETGCNSHGLRKFRDDADKAPLLTSRAMAFIGRFYDAEAGPSQGAHRRPAPDVAPAAGRPRRDRVPGVARRAPHGPVAWQPGPAVLHQPLGCADPLLARPRR